MLVKYNPEYKTRTIFIENFSEHLSVICSVFFQSWVRGNNSEGDLKVSVLIYASIMFSHTFYLIDIMEI